MAAPVDVHGRRFRGHHHIVSSQAPAIGDREADSTASWHYLLGLEPRLHGKWSRQLHPDRDSLLQACSSGTDGLEDPADLHGGRRSYCSCVRPVSIYQPEQLQMTCPS